MIIDFENDKKGGGTSCELQEVAVTYTANGTSEIVPEAGYDGVSKATVTVEVPDPETEVLTATITENGAKSYTPTKYGYSKVDLTVDVPTPEPVLEELKATTNGSYTPQAPAVGYSKVDVNVPGGAGPAMVDFGSIGYDNNDVAEYNTDLAYSKQKFDEWDPTSTSAHSLYEDDKNLVYAPKIDTSKVISTQQMFNGCTSLTTVPLLDTSSVKNMNYMFNGCSSLTTVPLLDTSSATDMMGTFVNCTNLSAIPQLNTSKVTNMYTMFSGCSSLTTVPLLDTSSATDMYRMFSNCSSLTTVPLLDTSSVYEMTQMFERCISLTTIPQFNTSKVTEMIRMFYECTSLTTVPLLDCTSLKSNGSNFGLSYQQSDTLTTLGGFKNLKISTNIAGPSFKPLNKITKESVLNVITNLGQADPAFEAAPKLTLSPTQYGYLTEADIAGATAKGWSIVQG